MASICVEVDNEFLAEFKTHAHAINWTITGELMASASRTTFVEIDAPDAPDYVDGWLCSPALFRAVDGSVYVGDYGAVTDLHRVKT